MHTPPGPGDTLRTLLKTQSLADVAAANGVIHVIDTVVLPAAPVEDPAKAKPKDHPAH